MKDRFDIVIAGAGMTGLTLAALLRRCAAAARLNVHVLDAGPRPQYAGGDLPDLRVSAISPGSAEILQRAGVWDDIRACRACPYQSMRVWDAAGSAEGTETLRFDAADLGIPELGFIVENTLIQDRLLRRLEDLDTVPQFGSPIRRLSEDDGHFVAEYGKGAPLRAELVIGADGAASTVRTEAGIGARRWRYPQSAFVTHAEPGRCHADTAWQRFLPDGPIALLPLADGRVSLVWSTTPERAARALAASDDALAGLLSEASDHVLGRLSPVGPRASFPLQAQYAERYCRQGLVLVGDAAHSVHPLAGQGVNLGFADAAALACEIAGVIARGEHPGDLPGLRRYERARKGDNLLMLHFIEAINRLFAAELAPLAKLRGGGMRLFNRSGPIRRRIVRVALGLGR
ncbi:MAG: UbiH/UbiF/VisC/COQ6 family ubiquinone biosynthesis hydroxylase [Woeseiaceae bacterium]